MFWADASGSVTVAPPMRDDGWTKTRMQVAGRRLALQAGIEQVAGWRLEAAGYKLHVCVCSCPSLVTSRPAASSCRAVRYLVPCTSSGSWQLAAERPFVVKSNLRQIMLLINLLVFAPSIDVLIGRYFSR